MLQQAAKQVVMVVTRDPAFLDCGMLAAIPDSDPDDLKSHKRGKYSRDDNVLRVPGGTRALASFRGNDIYMFDHDGGMSWRAPYIAGLAALAFQVRPEITPKRIIQLLKETATRTDTGPIVNPGGFIAEAEKKAHGTKKK